MRRSPAIPYMIWIWSRLPAIARSSHSFQACAELWKPALSRVNSVSVASRSQQYR
jgi:hypothetical protein